VVGGVCKLAMAKRRERGEGFGLVNRLLRARGKREQIIRIKDEIYPYPPVFALPYKKESHGFVFFASSGDTLCCWRVVPPCLAGFW
jgi:hypothetical protein